MRTLLLLALPFLPAPVAAAAPAQDVERVAWRAWLESPGGELPFGLVLERAGEDWSGFLENGPERVPVPRVQWDGLNLHLGIDHYASAVRAFTRDGGETLEGTWRKRSGDERWASLRFRARRGTHPRFPVPAGAVADAAPVAGRWAVDFESDELPAVGIFEAGAGGAVTGTFLTATGDYRFLAGAFAGGELRLSCFDGAHAFLFHARLRDDGTLAGDFWSRDSWHETWTARRDAAASLGDAFAQTTWDERAALSELVFPDLEGTPRALDDPAFAGRARLIVLFGSWCPNCHDETAYLVELDRRYRRYGLSILGLAFELTGDHEEDARQVRVYAEHFGVEYPILVAGIADKAAASRAFPAIDRLRSYPTTIFLDGENRVRWVHSGFSGPATGEAHAELRREFEARIEELLGTAVRVGDEPRADDAAPEVERPGRERADRSENGRFAVRLRPAPGSEGAAQEHARWLVEVRPVDAPTEEASWNATLPGLAPSTRLLLTDDGEALVVIDPRLLPARAVLRILRRGDELAVLDPSGLGIEGRAARWLAEGPHAARTGWRSGTRGPVEELVLDLADGGRRYVDLATGAMHDGLEPGPLRVEPWAVRGAADGTPFVQSLELPAEVPAGLSFPFRVHGNHPTPGWELRGFALERTGEQGELLRLVPVSRPPAGRVQAQVLDPFTAEGRLSIPVVGDYQVEVAGLAGGPRPLRVMPPLLAALRATGGIAGIDQRTFLHVNHVVLASPAPDGTPPYVHAPPGAARVEALARALDGEVRGGLTEGAADLVVSEVEWWDGKRWRRAVVDDLTAEGPLAELIAALHALRPAR